ncbi:hypothetical protein RI138_21255 [Streptomyces sp. C11-1]|uniref:DNA primase n=1 Tax=Streptomyces durocortorensis TaxID=2811104 RepID=A0ABY9VZD9_9ACTN|nr:MULTISPECIES: hypothetical protein [Streptomyces]WNF29148.1 hypothetical protein RI138_21255 [Streptomyces durocortorensis]
MTTEETSRFVRLRVEMVLEVTDLDALTGTALESIAAEYGEPLAEVAVSDADERGEEERMHAEAAVRADGAEALASLVDPFDLVGEVPGVELAQASWSSESIDFDPDAEGWDEDADDEEDALFLPLDEGDEEGPGSTVTHNGKNDREDGDPAQRV